MSSDFPTPRQAGSTVVRWGVALGVAATILGLVFWGLGVFSSAVTAPVDMARGVGQRVMDPDHALDTYRWFHGANQTIKAKKGQIALAKQALAASSPDRQEARRVELLGLQQGCQQLVSEYNAKATRADTVIFQHPERFLPGNWPGDRDPLPSSIDLNECL